MNIHTIKTKKDYEDALEKISSLFNAPEGSQDLEQLELLSILVEEYENKHFVIDEPDPIEAINVRMEQLGMSRKDLEASIGSRARVSDILNRRRSLSLSMIRKLHQNLKIPASILIQEITKKIA